MAKGRRRRRKKLHGDVMTTFDKVARRPRGDGYSAEGSAAAAAAAAADQPVTTPVDAAAGGGGRRMRQEGGGGGWGSNAEAEMVCGVSSHSLY
jgi:hypothetical protein